MRIESFSVQGFANFSGPADMGPLEDVNILYGPNNGGKSNLLRAVELYFRLLGAGEAVTKAQRQMLDQPDAALQALLTQSFNRAAPRPIVFEVEWSLPEADLRSSGLHPDFPCGRVTTGLEVEWLNRSFELRIRKWALDGDDVAGKDRNQDPALHGFAQQIRRLLADACPFQNDQPVLPVVRIGASPEPFPQSLRDALFDARMSRDTAKRRRWTLFAELAGTLRAELGPGTWETTFDREAGRADLLYIQEGQVLTLESMGSGVQRLAGLLGELALAKEGWVLMEEPEWRLSPELQKRLVALGRRAAAAGLGPRQYFFTTHSPTLAGSGSAFCVHAPDGSPTVERKPWALSADSDTLDDGLGGQAGQRGEELGQLIGLVDTLAALEPEQLVPAGGRR